MNVSEYYFNLIKKACNEQNKNNVLLYLPNFTNIIFFYY